MSNMDRQKTSKCPPYFPLHHLSNFARLLILELESNDHALRAFKLAHEKNTKPKINLFSLPLGALELGTPSEDSGSKDD